MLGEEKEELPNVQRRASISLKTISFLKKSVGESPERWKNIIGLICVFCVVFLWVSSGELIQLIYTSNFSKPLFVTYFSTALFTVYFFGFFFSSTWRELILKPLSHQQSQTIFDIAVNGLILCPLWFGAVLSYNSALSLTSVSSNTILSSTSSIFTFLLSFLLGIDSFSSFRLTSVFIVISGVCLVTLSDTSSIGGNDTVIGHILSLTGAFMYGIYTTFMKKRVPNESPSMVLLLYAFVGLFNVILMWPLFIIFHFSGLEKFEIPSWEVLGFLFLNASFGTVLSDVFWCLSVILTKPVIATVGLSLSIPLSIAFDFTLQKHLQTFGIQYLIGSSLVVLGFFIN
eukprot:gene5888-9716_t